MFDLGKLQQVIKHLKSISTYYNESNKEIILFCPYCDDAKRHNPKHGHLYISQDFPVFNCFRCSTSGTLIRLLIDTNFKDDDILNYLAQFIKYKFLPDYYNSNRIQKKFKLKTVRDEMIRQNVRFQLDKPELFESYKQYLKERLGDINCIDFLITPSFYFDKLSCSFTNSNQESICERLIQDLIINNKPIRYHLNKTSSGLYYFQEKNFEKYNRIVMTEGPFDMLSLYLYNPEFKNCFFISISGKKYSSTIEKLVTEDLLIGKYQIDLVFDADVLNYNSFVMKSKFLVGKLNTDISIKGWLPLINNDVGDFPAVKEI